jgi:hypothetical protein
MGATWRVKDRTPSDFLCTGSESKKEVQVMAYLLAYDGVTDNRPEETRCHRDSTRHSCKTEKTTIPLYHQSLMDLNVTHAMK